MHAEQKEQGEHSRLVLLWRECGGRCRAQMADLGSEASFLFLDRTRFPAHP
jgi:hypothetical protein